RAAPRRDDHERLRRRFRLGDLRRREPALLNERPNQAAAARPTPARRRCQAASLATMIPTRRPIPAADMPTRVRWRRAARGEYGARRPNGTVETAVRRPPSARSARTSALPPPGAGGEMAGTGRGAA